MFAYDVIMDNIKLRDLKDKKFHFIGIGGISMSALALILKRNKIYVQGSDISKNAETEKLEKKGVKIFYEHSSKNIKDVDVVVYTSAISENNAELKCAISKKKIILKRAELLGMIAELYKCVIAVAGSHGKTTATAMICEIFMHAGLKPTFHIGGNLNSIKSNYKLGNKKFFITEACEYKDNFLFIKPNIAVTLNIDADHLDYFKDIDGVKNSFKKFQAGVKAGGISVVCNDDENSKCLLNGKNTATFGLFKGADIYAVNIKEYKPCHYSFDVVFSKFKLGNIKLNIIGKHNILNALASVLVSLACAIDFCYIKEALESFSGVERRCQKITEIHGIQIYHDYAHHPEQIKKMIEVGKCLTKKKNGKVIVVFEPHTYSRTMNLIDEFVGCFKNADKVILAPVYSAREDPVQGYDSLKLLSEVKNIGVNAEYLESFSQIKSRVLEVAEPNDVVLILGAGTIENLAKMLKNKVLCET